MQKLLLPLAASALLASAASAQIVYESFSYTAGTNTASAANASSTATTTGLTASGTGLSGNWVMHRGGSGNNVSGTSINASSLGAVAYGAEGGRLDWSGFGSTAAGNQLTANLSSASSSALAPAASNKTLWMSALIRPGTFANGGGVFLGNNAVSGDTVGATVFGLGFNSGGNAVVSYNNGLTAATAGTFTASSTYWLVGNFTYSISGGTTTFSAANLWIQDASSGAPAASEGALGIAMASWTGTSTTTGSRAPFSLLVKTGSSVANSSFDSIRVGTSYGSVIPEPSTYAALIGVAALGLAVWFRRRS